MSRIPALLGAAALFVSFSTFAQTATPPSDNSPTTSASASSDMSQASGETTKHRRHMHHADRSAANSSTDWTADKLNACMAFANPSASQEDCLKQASHS